MKNTGLKIGLVITLLWGIGAVAAFAQERGSAPKPTTPIFQRKTPEVRFNLPAAQKKIEIVLPEPEAVIRVVEEIKNILVDPICPVPPIARAACSLNLVDVSGPSNDFELSWDCSGGLRPCTITMDTQAFTQVNGPGSAKLNLDKLLKRDPVFQMKDKDGSLCGTQVAHAYKAGPGNTIVSAVPGEALPSTFTQSGYRWFNNDDSTTPGDAVGSMNTRYENLSGFFGIWRLRLLIHVGDGDLAAAGQAFKLQSALEVGTCATTPTGDFTDVAAASTPWRTFNNTTPADGDAISSTADDPTHSGHTVVLQNYQEANNFNNPSGISAGQDGLWDFALRDNTSFDTTDVCFRVVKSDGTLLDAYSVYPQICSQGEGSNCGDVD